MRDDATFQSAVDRLREYYGEYARGGHADSIRSLEDIESIVKDRESQKMLITFMQNPWSKRLLDMAVGRYSAACNRQMKPEIRSDLQQKIDVIDKDWALVFITLLGGDPRKAMDDGLRRVEEDLNRTRRS